MYDALLANRAVGIKDTADLSASALCAAACTYSHSLLRTLVMVTLRSLHRAVASREILQSQLGRWIASLRYVTVI